MYDWESNPMATTVVFALDSTAFRPFDIGVDSTPTLIENQQITFEPAEAGGTTVNTVQQLASYGLSFTHPVPL